MTFDFEFESESLEDLERLFDFLVERAETVEEVERAQASIDFVRATITDQLEVMPYSFRKVGKSATLRELIIPSGSTGYVALFEILSEKLVVVLAIRHQREQDYH